MYCAVKSLSFTTSGSGTVNRLYVWLGQLFLAGVILTEELAAHLGNQTCVYMGKDDKSHVPIRITAANKKSPLLMHLQYCVSLPDHTFVVATKHKLSPTTTGTAKDRELACRGQFLR